MLSIYVKGNFVVDQYAVVRFWRFFVAEFNL